MTQDEQHRIGNGSEVRELLSPTESLPTYEESRQSTDSKQNKRDRGLTESPKAGHASMLQIVSLPLLNIVICCVLIGVLLYIYIKANGQSTEYTMAGMKIPTLVALMMTLIKMCMAGGLGYALSEYKWVKLQHGGGKLALLDVYDACTRGFGGMIRVFSAIPLDFVLVPAIIFQIGLIAMGPASQQILVVDRPIDCSNDRTVHLQRINPQTQILYTNDYQASKTGVRSLIGVSNNFAIQYALAQASQNQMFPMMHNCPSTALNCTFPSVHTLHTALECQDGSLETTRVLSPRNNTVLSLSDLYSSNLLETVSTPAVFYAASMHGRTLEDAGNNITTPTTALETLNVTDIRPYVGDQSIVLVTNSSSLSKSGLTPKNKLKIYECTLRSFLNESVFVANHSRDLIQTVLSSTPIMMNYDDISNITTFHSPSNEQTVMINAYALQLSIIRSFIYYVSPFDFATTASHWSFPVIPMWDYLSKVLHDMSLASTMVSLYFTTINPLEENNYDTNVCEIGGTTSYVLNPSAYYAVSLSLLLPLIWWVLIWMISLYQTNGVSRGNSQIALMVTGLTPAIQDEFKGYSHAGQGALFQKSKGIDVQFGVTRTNDGQATFGCPEELNQIRHRRTSFSANLG